MKRLYFLTDHLETTERIARTLSKVSDTQWHYHVVSKDTNGLIRHQIRSARKSHLTDWVRQSEQGALIGLILGVILAGFYAAFNPQVLPLPLTSWLSFILTPMVILGLVGFVWGGQALHYKLTQYRDALDYGCYLILIDVPKERAIAIRHLLVSRFPEITVAGEGTSFAIPFVANR